MATDHWTISDFGWAYRTWRLAARPRPDVASLVRRWARTVTCEGPSGSAIPISDTDEDFVDWVHDTNVFIAYVVSPGDRHVVVKEITL